MPGADGGVAKFGVRHPAGDAPRFKPQVADGQLALRGVEPGDQFPGDPEGDDPGQRFGLPGKFFPQFAPEREFRILTLFAASPKAGPAPGGEDGISGPPFQQHLAPAIVQDGADVLGEVGHAAVGV